MELDHNKFIEKPDNYSNKPSMKLDYVFPFEPPSSSSSKGLFLQDFHHLDQFRANESSLVPMFGVLTGSNFHSFDAFPYGSPSTNVDYLYDYECKPLADSNGGHGQVMDNFQSEGGGYLMNLRRNQNNNPIDTMVGSNQHAHMSLHFQEMKPINLVVPDEVSCVPDNNNHHHPHKKVGLNKNRAPPSARKTWKCRKKNNAVKGQWTIDEDRLLTQLVQQYGIRKWSHIAQMLPGRNGKQCRERWHNHLRPDIKKDIWSEEEDKVLIQAHAEIGNKWAEIGKRLPGRTENSIKNHWNATKRRQYSKRKCRSKYPRGSLLQEYIKSLNLDSSAAPAAGRCQQGKTRTSTIKEEANQAQLALNQSCSQNNDDDNDNDYRLVRNSYDFNGLPEDFDFDEKMFQEGCCSFDSLLDEKSFEMDVTSLMMDFEVKKELDFVEMISRQAKM